MPEIKPLPKETGVAAELYSSLVATFPPPNPLMKLHENSHSKAVNDVVPIWLSQPIQSKFFLG